MEKLVEVVLNNHHQFITRITKILEMGRVTFYQNLETMYIIHDYVPNNIWNVYKFEAQSGKEWDNVLTRKHQKRVRTKIPIGTEYLTMLSVIHVSGKIILNFYIFKEYQRRRYYNVFCEPFATIAMQKNVGWIGFIFIVDWTFYWSIDNKRREFIYKSTSNDFRWPQQPCYSRSHWPSKWSWIRHGHLAKLYLARIATLGCCNLQVI